MALEEGNKAIVEQLGNFFNIKANLIQSGVDLCNVEDAEKSSENFIKLIYYGRFTANKNILSVIESVANYPSIQFDIYGEGPEKNNYLKLIYARKINNVTVNDYINHDKICSVLNGYDYFIMPSFKETFGLSYIESMSAGVIPIGTKGQGIDGVIVDDYNGFLTRTDKESIDSILNKIQNLSCIDRNEIKKSYFNSKKLFCGRKI